ncbi:MAG: TrkA family potassium uptake protein [Actinobacteria bacterium]|jgi:trk system potassium uptake protein TrkA|nr:TrkA family potassium uptake protein [Micrococcales bacterium]MCB0903104.1 TrkA family potassium uptake protein [Actinomycetota bacterium]MCO5298802.1 TrkA family potassium uptake protein [Candidatus Nanopelagicales bacterium]MCB9428712.1 TrkA family potassium uptake protein [Actinomycetota bacterium]HPE12149.1 TrkA family potassium uptake protein [Actinomycetota bacterium]
MRVAVAGAGKVGKSIARELAEIGHDVLLIDRDADLVERSGIEGVNIVRADACEMASLELVGLEHCQVVVAATGDDKVNLVVSLLSKTEYGVPRVVARVNHPKNEWLFDQMWGVDVAVSTPRLLSALVEEAVAVGDLVRLMTFRQSRTNLVEMTLPHDSNVIGRAVGDVEWPVDTSLVAILREDRVIAPTPDDPLEVGDELLFVAIAEQEQALSSLLH